MRSAFDFGPLYRSTIGYDRLPTLLESAAGKDAAALGYPPYDIEKLDEDSYRITMAVAGFAIDDLEIETRENTLHVSGNRKDTDGNSTYLYRGISGRPFKRKFQLADHVKVTDAFLDNGLLHIELAREIPEAMKPRQIEITTPAHGGNARTGKLQDNTRKAA